MTVSTTSNSVSSRPESTALTALRDTLDQMMDITVWAIRVMASRMPRSGQILGALSQQAYLDKGIEDCAQRVRTDTTL